MPEYDDTTILYHGTDVDSALSILNEGLNAERLLTLQRTRPTQVGHGWYATPHVDVAWFFASFAPGNVGQGYTVIEIELPKAVLNRLIRQKLAVKSEIADAPFRAKQYWFSIRTFDLLNKYADMRPYTEQGAH